jgi:hypothetical protein
MAQVNEVLGSSVNSGMAAKMQIEQMKAIQAQVDLTTAQAEKTRAESLLTQAQIPKVEADTQLSKGQYGQLEVQAREILERILGYPVQREVAGATAAEIRERTKNYPGIDLLNRSAGALNLTKEQREAVEVLLKRYDLNQAKAGSEFYGGAIGEQAPLARFLLQLLSAIKGATK